jgi:hypothetical protein
VEAAGRLDALTKSLAAMAPADVGVCAQIQPLLSSMVAATSPGTLALLLSSIDRIASSISRPALPPQRLHGLAVLSLLRDSDSPAEPWHDLTAKILCNMSSSNDFSLDPSTVTQLIAFAVDESHTAATRSHALAALKHQSQWATFGAHLAESPQYPHILNILSSSAEKSDLFMQLTRRLRFVGRDAVVAGARVAGGSP